MVKPGVMEIFAPFAGTIDLRDLLAGRGESIETGLSIIDADVPIAGIGTVDLVGIDSARRLVVIDLAASGETDERRVLAHAAWFRENLPIVRRMYQLWNVRWDMPSRLVWVSTLPATGASIAARPGHDSALAVERMTAVAIRTHDGREAVLLTSGASAQIAAWSQPAAAERKEEPSAPRRATPTAESRREIGGAVREKEEKEEGGENAQRPSPSEVSTRGEAYRRELGLTPDEFAEFFTGPGLASRAPQGGGVR